MKAACFAAVALGALAAGCPGSPPAPGGSTGPPPCTPSSQTCTCDGKQWSPSNLTFTFGILDKTTRCLDPQQGDNGMQTVRANSLADATACMKSSLATTNDEAVSASSVKTFVFAVYAPDGAGGYVCSPQPAASDSPSGAQTCLDSTVPCPGCVYKDITAQVSTAAGEIDPAKVGAWCNAHPTP